MSNDDTEFTPEQVEQQIDLLTQSQVPYPDPRSSTRFISELYQVYTEDDATVENAWLRLAAQINSHASLSVAGDATHQRRSHIDTPLERLERPQSMNSNATEKRPHNKMFRLLGICAAILVIGALTASMTILINDTHHQSTLGSNSHATVTPATTRTPNATATVPGSILFSDPLSENIHSWPASSNGSGPFFFKDNAYHIKNIGANSSAVVCPQQNFLGTSLTYQITMEEIAGDETSPNNSFGLIFNYNEPTVKGIKIDTFYTFEIFDEGPNSSYAFYKYDSSNPSYPWILLSTQVKAGPEFHSGHGAQATNVAKVVENGSSFTFFINGQQVYTANDSSLQGGSVGMLVNLKGTEVAFSNLLVTRP